MVFKPVPEPTLLEELRRRANLVHGISKEPHSQDLARMMLRLVPQLEALVQQATYDSSGSIVGQTKAMEGFVSTAGSLTRTLAEPHR